MMTGHVFYKEHAVKRLCYVWYSFSERRYVSNQSHVSS
jgi:hypothetical protein